MRDQSHPGAERLVVLFGALALLASSCAWTARVSVDTHGGDADDYSRGVTLSADGRYVAFASEATDLVADDTNGRMDVFRRDLRTLTTIRVSVDTTGDDADHYSFRPSISADGRYVAFSSKASDLVADDGNGVMDVFVRDVQTSSTTRVSVAVDVDDADAASGYFATPSIAGDGRSVAFTSAATNLIANDGNGLVDVFVRDLEAGVTTRASVDVAGSDPDGGSTDPALAAAGGFVAFSSGATDLVAGDTNGRNDVFVHDLDTLSTVRVSVDTSDGDADGNSWHPAIDASGRYVAFSSHATDLVVGDGNGVADVFLRDLGSTTTTRLSVDTTGDDGDRTSSRPEMSANGRFVGWESEATDLVSNDTNGILDLFVRDVDSGTTTRVSTDVLGREAQYDDVWGSYTIEHSFSADGALVGFVAPFALADDDGNDTMDVYVRSTQQPVVESVSPAVVPRGGSTVLTVTGSAFSTGAQVSVDAAGVAVDSVTVVDTSTITVGVSVAVDAELGPTSVWVNSATPGPGFGALGLCGWCVTVVE